MSDVSIRIANAEDAELVAEISRETFCETFGPFNTQSDMDKFLSQQFVKEKLVEQVTREGTIFLLAYINNEPAGYVFLKEGTHEKLYTNNAMEICRLYSRTLFIGKGVGKALMLAAITQAKQLRKEILWLGVWKYNQRAARFYTAFGFEKFGEQDFLLGDDVQRDWVMKLAI